MKLYEAIVLSILAFLVIVGIHQTMLNGFVESYWIFMLTILLLSLFRLYKSRKEKKA